MYAKLTIAVLFALVGHAVSECSTRRTEGLSARECADDCKCSEKPCSLELSWKIERLTGRPADLEQSLCTCRTCVADRRNDLEGAEDTRPPKNRCVIREKGGINEAECKQSCYCSSAECTGRWRWSAKNRADYRTFVCECELCNDSPRLSAPIIENRYMSIVHH